MKGFTSFTGDWYEEETVHTGRYEMNFRLSAKGRRGTFEYSPYFFKTGDYRVYAWFPTSPDYGSEVPVHIHHAGGRKTISINQREGGGRWQEMGLFRFAQGKHLAVELEAGPDRQVAADAFKFELATGR